MSVEILVFDPHRETGEALARRIRDSLGRPSRGLAVSCRDPAEVFTKPLPESPKAAFFAVSGMYDAEAVRKFHALRPGAPLVIVSDSGDYGVWSWSVGACFYLLRPVPAKELGKALGRCKVNKRGISQSINGGKEK